MVGVLLLLLLLAFACCLARLPGGAPLRLGLLARCAQRRLLPPCGLPSLLRVLCASLLLLLPLLGLCAVAASPLPGLCLLLLLL